MSFNIPLKYEPDYHAVTAWQALFDKFASESGLPTKINPSPCPCAGEHTTPSRDKDYYVYLNSQYPTDDGFIFVNTSCWHNSCHNARTNFRDSYNQAWVRFVRANIAGKDLPRLTRPPGWVAQAMQDMRDRYKRDKEIHERRKIINKLNASIKDIPLPVPVFATPEEDVQHHVAMFQSEDILFWGDKDEPWKYYVVGQEITSIPNFTSSWTFKLVDGKFNRDVEHCLSKPYTVLELDDHSSKGVQFQRLLVVARHFNIPLLMALDSGGKSIHGWFFQKDLENQLDFISQMGYDMATATHRSQPVRLAGSYRKEKDAYQRIIYWDYENWF